MSRLRATVLALLLLGPAVALTPVAPAAAGTAAGVDRTIGDRRITESSGLAASLRRPGVLWTHNDSGNSARIYAIGRDGSTLDAVRVSGTRNRDWEAIAALRDRSGRPLLAIGDIGDNTESDSTVEVVVLAEPAAGQRKVAPLAVLSLRYPDGPVNAEALMVDPTSGRMYLATKELLGTRLFELPTAAWPGAGRATATLVQVGSAPIGLVTDGAFLPDGRLVLRNYGSVQVLQRPADAGGGRLRIEASQDTPVQDQGESVAVLDDGATLLLGSEGDDQPVYRMPVPGGVSPSLTGSEGTPAPTAEEPLPTVVQTPPTAPAAADDGARTGRVLWAGPLLAAVLTALVLGAVVAFSRWRAAGR